MSGRKDNSSAMMGFPPSAQVGVQVDLSKAIPSRPGGAFVVPTHPSAFETGSNKTGNSNEDATSKSFYKHASARRVCSDAVATKTLRAQYPHLELVSVPDGNVSLFGFAAAGFASYSILDEDDWLSQKAFLPPMRRTDGGRGWLVDQVSYAKFMYKWKGDEFLVYLIDGRDGTQSYPKLMTYYILSVDKAKTNQLILEAGRWSSELHDEIWVFDRGYWSKSRELFDSIRNASWDSVILDEKMKKALIEDHLSFFESRDSYAKLKVPWKRGLIYYGPPGNGKTISIKAMMNMLYSRKDPIPTLYVRSLVSYLGPQAAVEMIFEKARQMAPCYLILEDLDTIINEQVRSYFLNEVDGLKPNDGILMVGSTNHLDRLDPGISKRPSRFDRKYLFPDPNHDERVSYCHFWQKKLSSNKDVAFPDELCPAIADITDKFSFAYIQEAFVASLLALARQSKDQHSDSGFEQVSVEGPGDDWVGVGCDGDKDHDDLNDFPLWVEIKKQVAILRAGMDETNTMA